MFMLQLGGWFIFSLERAFGPMTVISSTWSGGDYDSSHPVLDSLMRDRR